MSEGQITVPDNLVKIRYDKERNWLVAFMPDGQEIQAISTVKVIHGEPEGPFAVATIEIVVDDREVKHLYGHEFDGKFKDSMIK